jgi:glycosyltransferase involved in cell wall biosynthesis
MMLSRAAGAQGAKKYFLKREAKLLKAYEEKYCPHYARNLVVSETDRQRLGEIVPTAKMETIENPVDLEYWSKALAVEGRPEVLFVGGLDWYPNRDAVEWFCKEVCPLLLKSEPKLSITVVGKKDPTGELEARYQGERIRFEGFVKDVRPYFRRARVFVCPMRTGGGTNLKIIDAFASRVPVVSTSFGTRGLSIHDRRDILIADSPGGFAESIRELFNNDPLHTELCHNAFSLAEKTYSADRIGAKLTSLYSSLKP